MDVVFNRKTVISFPGTEIPSVENTIAEGSLYLDEVLFTDKFTIGLCNANRFEVELYDFDTVSKGTPIYVYQEVTETGTTSEVPLFTGYVDTCTTNRGRYEDSKKIVAYDCLFEYSGKNVASWWSGCFDSVDSVTVKELRDSLFDYLNIDYEDVTLPNDNVKITHTQNVNTISFSAVLNYIMLINGTNAKCDRSGVVRFIVTSDREPIEIDDTYAQNTSEFDSYSIPAYTGVRIVNSTKNITVLAGTSTNVLEITDNMLLMKKSQASLQAIAERILDAIKDVTYRPASIDMIYTQLNILVGDRVKISDKEYLVCENILSGSLLVDQHITSVGAKAFEQATQTYNATQKEMQTEIAASSLKYYKFQNQSAVRVGEDESKPVINIRYTCSDTTVITFQGCIIMDVDVIDETKPAVIVAQYMINNELVQTYTPTETYFYFDGNTQKHTLNLFHYWDYEAGKLDVFRVYLTCTNCEVLINAFREEGLLSGMGLVGEAAWDGIIEVEDNIISTRFATEPRVESFTDEAQIILQDIIVIEAEDNISDVALESEPVSEPFIELLQINKEPISDHVWAEMEELTWAEIEDRYYW
jgi:hypothetical protein